MKIAKMNKQSNKRFKQLIEYKEEKIFMKKLVIQN